VKITSNRETVDKKFANTIAFTVVLNDAGGIGNPQVIDSSLVRMEIRSEATGNMVYSYYAIETTPNSNIYVLEFDATNQALGNYTVVAMANDNAGNMGRDSLRFAIADSSAPVTPPTQPPINNTPPVPPVNNTPPPTPPAYSDQMAASNVIAALQAKIAIAHQQGLDTTAAEIAAARAVVLQNEGKYAAAALEAQQGQTQIDEVFRNQSQQPPAPAPDSGGQSAMAAQASRLTSELEVKIAVAKKQGISVSTIEPSVNRSKALQQQGKYVEAALEAQAATALLDEKLAGNEPIKPISQQGFYMPCPVAPMLVSGLLLFALVAERRKEKKN
jgi:hypothetical protein